MAVCSILYQLATRREEQDKLYKELKTILPDPNTPLDCDKLDQMIYMKSFVKEVFRYVIDILQIQKYETGDSC